MKMCKQIQDVKNAVLIGRTFVFLRSAIWCKTSLDLQHFKINPRPHFVKVPFSVSHKQYQIFLNAPKSKETIEIYILQLLEGNLPVLKKISVLTMIFLGNHIPNFSTKSPQVGAASRLLAILFPFKRKLLRKKPIL